MWIVLRISVAINGLVLSWSLFMVLIWIEVHVQVGVSKLFLKLSSQYC